MPRPKTDNVRVHLLLTRKQYTRIQTQSEKTGLSISEIMRRATDLYIISTTRKKESGKV